MDKINGSLSGCCSMVHPGFKEERPVLNQTDKIFDTPKLMLTTPLTSMFLKVALPSNDESLIIVRPLSIVAARFWVHLQKLSMSYGADCCARAEEVLQYPVNDVYSRHTAAAE